MVIARESDHRVVIVGRWVGVERELGIQLDNSHPVPLNLAVHRSTGGNRYAELGDTRRDVEGLRRGTRGQGDGGR